MLSLVIIILIIILVVITLLLIIISTLITLAIITPLHEDDAHGLGRQVAPLCQEVGQCQPGWAGADDGDGAPTA